MLRWSLHDLEAAQDAYAKVGAILRELIDARPNRPDFACGMGANLNNIGVIDLERSRFDDARRAFEEAARWQEKAVAAQPRNGEYRQFMENHLTNLMKACVGLRDQSGLNEARKRLDEFQATDPRLRELDARLDLVLRGELVHDENERLILAQRAYAIQRFADATQLWSEALNRNPSLGEDRVSQHRYNAACAATLAAAGSQQGTPSLQPAQSSELRMRALEWLNAELDTWVELLTTSNRSGGGQRADLERKQILAAVKHWTQDPDLKSVRGGAIQALPEEERPAWRTLWARVEELILKANHQTATSIPDSDEGFPTNPFANRID